MLSFHIKKKKKPTTFHYKAMTFVDSENGTYICNFFFFFNESVRILLNQTTNTNKETRKPQNPTKKTSLPR
jgi:hypothetical protein